MSFALIASNKFSRNIKRLNKRYASMPDYFARLIAELKANPQAGEPLGRDCYKVRVRIEAKGKGKSGGARAITCVKIIGEQIFLLTIYDKSDQESISDNERDELLRENGLL
ncbi:hypothetical protein A0257_00885 [Hymenobacter psoromatis]|nr:hypothetical protein A0257_00885 [Hymenobacter psoromatis]